jgi:hypothetical protein
MIKQGLELIGDFIVDQLRKTLVALDHKATGNLIKSLRSDVTESGNYTITIYGADYAEAVNNGLPPGSKVSTTALAKWVEKKGIATGESEVKNIAFLIARKIFNEGTIQYRENKEGFIEITLDANAQAIFKMVLDLFKKEITLSLTNTIRQNKQTFTA